MKDSNFVFIWSTFFPVTISKCKSSAVTKCKSSAVTKCKNSAVSKCKSSVVTKCKSSVVTKCKSSAVTKCKSSTVTKCKSSVVTKCKSSAATSFKRTLSRSFSYLSFLRYILSWEGLASPKHLHKINGMHRDGLNREYSYKCNTWLMEVSLRETTSAFISATILAKIYETNFSVSVK